MAKFLVVMKPRGDGSFVVEAANQQQSKKAQKRDIRSHLDAIGFVVKKHDEYHTELWLGFGNTPACIAIHRSKVVEAMLVAA
jgi:hypothetical protein